ncbi:hypothetical protein [Mobiluncus mulieris]|nr:hypothetical protein [Mobiluncus mulieris]
MPGTDFNTTTTREPPAPRGKRLMKPASKPQPAKSVTPAGTS